jgi:hypothetical protein
LVVRGNKCTRIQQNSSEFIRIHSELTELNRIHQNDLVFGPT